jgi:hypothetical protein
LWDPLGDLVVDHPWGPPLNDPPRGIHFWGHPFREPLVPALGSKTWVTP